MTISGVSGRYFSRELELRRAVSRPTAIWASMPTVSTVAPLVLLCLFLAPTLVCWMYGYLIPKQAEWALRGITWPEDPGLITERIADEPVPPIPVWLWRATMLITSQDGYWRTCIPGWIFGISFLAAFLGFSRLWFTKSIGLLSCLLLSLNHEVLGQIQRGSLGPLVLFWTCLCLVFHALHLRRREKTFSGWSFGGGLAFGGLLLSAGAFAFLVPLIGLFNLILLEWLDRPTMSELTRNIRNSPTLRAGAIVVGIGLVIALPVMLVSGKQLTPFFPWASSAFERPEQHFAALDLFSAMRGTIVLALVGLWSSFRDPGSEKGFMGVHCLSLAWAAAACIALLACGSNDATILFAIVPLHIFAARTILDVRQRKFNDISVILFTVACLISFGAVQNRDILMKLIRDHLSIDGDTAFQLHLAGDVMILTIIALVVLYRLTAHSEQKRRALLGVCLLLVLCLSAWPAVTGLTRRKRVEDPSRTLFAVLRSQNDVRNILLVGHPDPQIHALVQWAVRSQNFRPDSLSVPDKQGLLHELKDADSNLLAVALTTDMRLFSSIPLTVGDKTYLCNKLHEQGPIAVYSLKLASKER